MNKSNKSNWYKLIWMVLIGLLLILGGVGGKMYMNYNHDAELAHKAERIIAAQTMNDFTGVTKIKFTITDTHDNAVGNWQTGYTVSATWAHKIKMGIEYGDPRDPEIRLKEIDILNNGALDGDENVVDSLINHRGKTTNKTVVIYSNGREETLHAK